MNLSVKVSENSSNPALDYDRLMSDEWQQLAAQVSQPALRLLQRLAREKADVYADAFYSRMLTDPEASRFLSSQQVHDRLHGAMSTWIVDILTNTGKDLAERIKYQKKIGQIHGRIGIPVNLVERGVRYLKAQLYRDIDEAGEDKSTSLNAVRFAAISMDIAIEIMNKSYSDSHNVESKNEESYRLFSILENASLERERQNGSLLHWENAFIFSVATGAPLSAIQSLGDSDFALWFNHKGKPNFGNVPGVRFISEVIKETDNYLTTLNTGRPLGPEEYAPLLKSIRSKVAEITILLGALFDDVQKLESGKDALTLLLNRRFLPTILRHEVSLAMQSQRSLSVAMLDIDDFKSINDTYGHAAGDRVLVSVAEMLHANMRTSDYIFRYGGEEFLLVLVETGKESAHAILERLRKSIASSPVILQGHGPVPVTISTGIAVYDGHPDYECLINAADKALYEAKARGKNRVEFASPEQ